MNSSTITEIINYIITSELEQFKTNFEVQPIPESQDICSLAIEWLCYNFKERISTANVKAITGFVHQVMSDKNYNTHGWSRIPALQAAAYCLTQEEYILHSLLENVSCEQATNRAFILQSVSVICPIIPFESEVFRDAVEYNFKVFHGLADIGLIVYLNTNGRSEKKLEWLKEISEWECFKNNKQIAQIISGEYIEINFFKDTLSKIKSHILFSILNYPISYDKQVSLFQERGSSNSKLNLFQDNHPLDKNSFIFKL